MYEDMTKSQDKKHKSEEGGKDCERERSERGREGRGKTEREGENRGGGEGQNLY